MTPTLGLCGGSMPVLFCAGGSSSGSRRIIVSSSLAAPGQLGSAAGSAWPLVYVLSLYHGGGAEQKPPAPITGPDRRALAGSGSHGFPGQLTEGLGRAKHPRQPTRSAAHTLGALFRGKEHLTVTLFLGKFHNTRMTFALSPATGSSVPASRV